MQEKGDGVIVLNFLFILTSAENLPGSKRKCGVGGQMFMFKMFKVFSTISD